MGIKESTVRGNTNIALIKYWGKRDKDLFLPTNSSISMTLDRFYTQTHVCFDSNRQEDCIELDGQQLMGNDKRKVERFLSLVRKETGIDDYAYVQSRNHVPIASGYASSASAFSALAGAALSAALEKPVDAIAFEWISRIARQGSGSACRSVYGGFVEWQMGRRDDGRDSYAVPILSKDEWPVAVVSVTVNRKAKKVSSREGMERTMETSPFYGGWLATIHEDLTALRKAIDNRDFTLLGQVLEYNAMKMHATMLGANPPVVYWEGQTLDIMEQVRQMRHQGLEAYATTDAGPNVKIICQVRDVQAIVTYLEDYDENLECIPCYQGDGLVQIQNGELE